MKAKTKNQLSSAPFVKSWHTAKTKHESLSSRFIYEATNHRRSRFYFEAIGPGSGLLTDDVQAVTISRVDIVTIAVNLNGEEAES
jgi:hypothetical protein